jgi:hypothetical protein
LNVKKKEKRKKKTLFLPHPVFFISSQQKARFEDSMLSVHFGFITHNTVFPLHHYNKMDQQSKLKTYNNKSNTVFPLHHYNKMDQQSKLKTYNNKYTGVIAFV